MLLDKTAHLEEEKRRQLGEALKTNGRRAPGKHVPLSSLPPAAQKALASRLPDPTQREQIIQLIDTRERAEARTRKARRRTQKAARRNNRRSR